MTPSQASALRAIVKNLIEASVADSWKGSQPAEDVPIIEADLEAAKSRFNSYVRKLTEHK